MPSKFRIEVSETIIMGLNKNYLRRVFRRAGTELKQTTAAMLRNSIGSGRKYVWKGKTYNASAPGQSPVSRSGALLKGLKVSVRRNGLGVTVRDEAPHARILEAGVISGRQAKFAAMFGSKVRPTAGRNAKLAEVFARQGLMRMTPRPFLSLALERQKRGISARIVQALQDGVEFKRRKVPKAGG